MANNSSQREALRGLEIPLFDLMAQVFTSAEWAQLLRTLLERAASLGDRGLTQRLLRSGVEFGNALHEAVGGGHGDIANDLLENGVSVEIEDGLGRTPLHIAAFNGETEMVQLLLLKGADVDAMDQGFATPLFDAARAAGRSGDPAVVFTLLAAGADVNLPNVKFCNRLPLHMAAFGLGVDVLRALIEHGTDVNAIDLYHDTALHCAAAGNGAEAIDFLVEAGANVGERNSVGYTPLHFVGLNANVASSRGLLSHGADVNARDSQNKTALHVAVANAGQQGSAELVDLLLRSGADEAIADNDNRVAADKIGAGFVRTRLAEEVERIRELLANAPVDRAWRRRGFLAMCRAYLGRVKLGREICSEDAGAGRSVARRTGSRENQGRAVVSGCSAIVEGGTADERDGGGLSGLLAKVLGLQEEGVFRTIVGYL